VPEIGLDLRMWDHPGIGRYMRELVTEMGKKDGSRFHVLGYERHAKDIMPRFRGGSFTAANSKIYGLAEQSELSVFSSRVKLLHVPHFNAPLFCRAKLVATIHDLIYLKEKRFSGSVIGKIYVKSMISGVARNASAVIAVSEFTRKDLEKAFPAVSGKTRVIYEAAAGHFGPDGTKGGDYFLFVGSLKAHKNLGVLLDAFERVRSNRPDAKLVVVGRKDPKEAALTARVESLAPSVRYLGEQPDEALPGLYRGARALVIPSLWEGFGLTAIEAMACGTPVISSDRASLPEVVGDAGILFDPENADILAGHMLKVLKDDVFRAELSKKGLERSERFSWERAARDTMAVYDKVLA
jgi:glycosyltransferase involved in cell wall biosynthesis